MDDRKRGIIGASIGSAASQFSKKFVERGTIQGINRLTRLEQMSYDTQTNLSAALGGVTGGLLSTYYESAYLYTFTFDFNFYHNYGMELYLTPSFNFSRIQVASATGLRL